MEDSTCEFADIKFKRDCTNIILTEHGDGIPLIFQGPGEIWQDDSGQLQFKCFAMDGFKEFQNHQIKRINSSEVGQLVPTDDFFLYQHTK